MRGLNLIHRHGTPKRLLRSMASIGQSWPSPRRQRWQPVTGLVLRRSPSGSRAMNDGLRCCLAPGALEAVPPGCPLLSTAARCPRPRPSPPANRSVAASFHRGGCTKQRHGRVYRSGCWRSGPRTGRARGITHPVVGSSRESAGPGHGSGRSTARVSAHPLRKAGRRGGQPKAPSPVALQQGSAAAAALGAAPSTKQAREKSTFLVDREPWGRGLFPMAWGCRRCRGHTWQRWRGLAIVRAEERRTSVLLHPGRFRATSANPALGFFPTPSRALPGR